MVQTLLPEKNTVLIMGGLFFLVIYCNMITLFIFYKKMSLDNVMDYVHCPCKDVNLEEPLAAMVVNKVTEGAKDEFNGVFHMKIEPMKDNKSGEEREHQFQELIQFSFPVSIPFIDFSGFLNIFTTVRNHLFQKSYFKFQPKVEEREIIRKKGATRMQSTFDSQPTVEVTQVLDFLIISVFQEK